MAPRPRKKTTAWGDAEGRRRDILGAARALVESGVSDLTMRDVALKARVSPGTIYVYFKTKEEIFLTLYAARVDAFADEVDAVCAEARDWDDLFSKFAERYLAFYRDYGHALNVWSLLADPAALESLPPDLTQKLRAQVVRTFTTASSKAREVAAAEGRVLRDDPLVMPFLWTVLTGLADNFSGPRAKAHPHRWEDMVRFAAQTLRAGLTELEKR